MSRSGSPARSAIAEAVAALVARGRVVLVHGRPAAGGQQHRLRLHEHDIRRCACRSSARRRARLPSAVLISSTARCSSSRSMSRAQTCSASRLMISMPVRSPLCTVRSKVCPAKAFWWTRAVGVAVEKAAQLVLQLVDALDRQRHQLPGEILVGQPLAALDRVHEVALDRVARGKRHVVAALDHARAAALAEQALDRDGDRKCRVGLVRVQRGEQAGAAGAEDQDVCGEFAHDCFGRDSCLCTWILTATAAPTSRLGAKIGLLVETAQPYNLRFLPVESQNEIQTSWTYRRAGLRTVPWHDVVRRRCG